MSFLGSVVAYPVMPSLTEFVLCLSALLLARWVYARRSRGNPNKLPHPPGPPGLPLIGNLRDMPTDLPWLTYQRWTRDYGSPLIRLNVLGNNIVVANTLKTATDLMEKRSAIYSDRHEMVMLNELCGFGWGLAFLRYGDYWKDCRRAFHQEFQSDAVKKFRPIEEKATHRLLLNLLKSPHDLMDHLRYMAGKEIMKIAYGIDVRDKDDEYISTAEHAVQAISATTNAGSYLVDALPFLKHIPEWFPGATFQKEARLWKTSVERMRHAPFDEVKRQIADGRAPECVATSLLERMAKNAEDRAYMEDVVRSTLGSMYTGGADTVNSRVEITLSDVTNNEQTVSALGSFFLAMVLNPEIQFKAQREIDQVLNNSRLPNFSDLHSLPYVDAIVKEALRWNPVVPLDVPHKSTADDLYEGFYIPKDTLVVGNSWAILHDEEVYPDPLAFNPDRFMRDGQINPEVQDPAVAAFGFGRRICPGRFMAYESMWIAIASTLAVFNISKAKNEGGVPVTPTGEYVTGFLCYPKPFSCAITPRSAEHEALIMANAV